MAEQYLPLSEEIIELLSAYGDAARGRLVSAMCAFFFTDTEPEFTGCERYVWPALRRMMLRMRASYEAKREAGRCGGVSKGKAPADSAPVQALPKQTQADAKQTQADAKQTQAEPNTKTNTKTKKEKEEKESAPAVAEPVDPPAPSMAADDELPPFVPPGREEVRVAFVSSGMDVDPDAFFDAMTRSGWTQKGEPVRILKQAMMRWLVDHQTSGPFMPRDMLERILAEHPEIDADRMWPPFKRPAPVFEKRRAESGAQKAPDTALQHAFAPRGASGG